MGGWPGRESPLGRLAARVIGFADDASDDDDLRLRKRVGVFAGLITTVGPLSLPAFAPQRAESWALAIVLPGFSVLNLVLLAVTRNFDRYVIGLIITCMAVPAATDLTLGGLDASSVGIVFAFLGPVYAILALGPRRATRWFVVFGVLLVVLVLIDPLLR